jgi:hypothetical protein
MVSPGGMLRLAAANAAVPSGTGANDEKKNAAAINKKNTEEPLIFFTAIKT